MISFVLYALCGAAAGVLGGMGMGGGTLLIPLLTILLGTAHANARIYNLISFVPMAIISLVVHSRNGLVKLKGTLPVVLSAGVTSIAACYAASFVRGEIASRIFGGFSLCVAAAYFIATIVKEKSKRFSARSDNDNTRNDSAICANCTKNPDGEKNR